MGGRSFEWRSTGKQTSASFSLANYTYGQMQDKACVAFSGLAARSLPSKVTYVLAMCFGLPSGLEACTVRSHAGIVALSA